MHLEQDRDQWRAVANTLMNLVQLSVCWLFKKDSATYNEQKA